jgi:cell division transport system permease protein
VTGVLDPPVRNPPYSTKPPPFSRAGLMRRLPWRSRAAHAGQTPIVPPGAVASRALVLVIAIMGYLASLTVGAVTVVADAAADWQSDIAREVTIQVRPRDGVDVAVAADKAVEIARAMPGAGVVHALSVEETRKLVEPWLGTGVDLAALPVPRLVSVEIVDAERADLAKLAADLSTAVPGASVDDHTAWAARLAGLATTAIMAGLAILALVLLAMALSVVFATRAAIASNRQVIEVLHFVGAEDRFIAAEFGRHFLIVGLKGALAGAGAAIVSFVAIGIAAAVDSADPTADLIGRGTVGVAGYLGVAAIVLVVTVLTTATSRLAVQRHLATLA